MNSEPLGILGSLVRQGVQVLLALLAEKLFGHVIQLFLEVGDLLIFCSFTGC